MGDRELDTFLDYLKQNQGCDLTVYKHSTLQRRLGVRMNQIGVSSYSSYLDYLKHYPNELARLLDTVFINFTSFFRDRDAWEYLADEIIPEIISKKKLTNQSVSGALVVHREKKPILWHFYLPKLWGWNSTCSKSKFMLPI